MEVILLKDVERLGEAGQVVKVKDGYGRNYLFPRNLAMPLTKNAMEFVKQRERQIAVKMKKEKQAAQELAKRLENVSCTIDVQVGEDEKLFGSVTSQDIEKALEKENIQIDKRKILIEEPIKKLGIFTVKLKLHPEVETPLKVWVVKR